MIHASAIRCLIAFVLAAALWGGCKPSVTPAAGQNPPPDAAAQPPPDAKHPPAADDLARFLRGKLPPMANLAELKSDPPVPLPGTASGSNAWTYNVRVTFAPTEDVLGPPAPHNAAVFRESMDELSALSAWSQAYARSPYVSHYPGFTVDPPVPVNLKLLALLHAKDQPLAPLYGKMNAEWQVDHWNYEVVSLQDPPDEPGKLRSQYIGPILIQGSLEADRFMAQVKASLDAAQPKKAAIDAAYHADLLKATQPGMTYKGTLTHGKNVLLAEARFLAAAPSDGPSAARMEFRLPDAGYTYLCTARLALSPPVQLTVSNHEAMDEDELSDSGSTPAPRADLAVGYLGVTDPKSSHSGTPASDFRSATMSTGTESKFWLSVQDGHLTGKMTLYDFNPPYFFDGRQVP